MKTILFTSILFAIFQFSLKASEPKAFEPSDNTVVSWDFSGGSFNKIQSTGLSPVMLRTFGNGADNFTWVDEGGVKALKFPGDGYLLPAKTTNAIDLSTGEVTLEAWVKLSAEDTGRMMGIFQCGEYSKTGFRLAVGADGSVQWMIPSGGKEVRLFSKEKLVPGEWARIVATYNGEQMRIFINDVADRVQALTGASLQPADNAQLRVGYVGHPERPFFAGEMSGVRILNKAIDEPSSH